VVFKPYPCNHFTHAGVGAALRLRAQGLAPADVTAIELSVAKPVLRTIAEPPEAKARPASGYHAAFSGPYTVAAALLGGGLGVSHEDFTDAAARDPRRLALAALVLRRGRALQRVVPARLPRRPARDHPHGRGT
jgi:2-methylcitrate dehydratase PrpD